MSLVTNNAANREIAILGSPTAPDQWLPGKFRRGRFLFDVLQGAGALLPGAVLGVLSAPARCHDAFIRRVLNAAGSNPQPVRLRIFGVMVTVTNVNPNTPLAENILDDILKNIVITSGQSGGLRFESPGMAVGTMPTGHAVALATDPAVLTIADRFTKSSRALRYAPPEIVDLRSDILQVESLDAMVVPDIRVNVEIFGEVAKSDDVDWQRSPCPPDAAAYQKAVAAFDASAIGQSLRLLAG